MFSKGDREPEEDGEGGEGVKQKRRCGEGQLGEKMKGRLLKT